MIQYLIKIINRFLRIKKITCFTRKNVSKNVLISYVLIPRYFIPFYFKYSHNNKYQTYLLAHFFFKRGYNVYIYDYTNTDINSDIEYDVFIGHNVTFPDIFKKIKNPDRKNYLLATGSSPAFGNKQQRLRIEDIWSRRKIKMEVYADNQVPDLSEAYRLADKVLMLGSSFIKETYDKKFHSKIKLINNVTLHPLIQYPSFRKRTNNFLFISSVGQIHRGLDLLLEIFSKKSYSSLYVLSAYSQEPDFLKHYGQMLFEHDNIFPIGFKNLTPALIKKLVKKVDFVILPSCSEGQSSSVINMMAYGLIPVVTPNVGIPFVEECGVVITSPTIENVQIAIDKALNLSESELLIKKKNLKGIMPLFSEAGFYEGIEEHIL